MRRRAFLGLAALLAAFASFPGVATVRRAMLPVYPPFVRAGALITPSWRWMKRDEQIYVLGSWIWDDGVRRALVSHWHLSTSMENTELPDSGSSPKELGFLETPLAAIQFAESTWERMPG